MGQAKANQIQKINKLRFTRCDITAIVFFIFFAVLLFDSVRYGIQNVDEGWYFTIPHRLMQGDRFIIDDWQVSQLTAVFQYIPFKIYYSLTGGTDGIILFFRQIEVVIKLIFFAFIYVSCRRYSWRALTAAVIFTAYNVYSYVTINYYSIVINALCLVGIVLFILKKYDVLSLIFCGFVFACAVVASPGTALAYIVYIAAVITVEINKKKKGKILSTLPELFCKRSFLFLSVGIAAAALIVLAICFIGADMRELIINLKEMPNDAQHVWGYESVSIINIKKLKLLISGGFIASAWLVFMLIAGMIMLINLKKLNVQDPDETTFKKKMILAGALFAAFGILDICLLFRTSVSPMANSCVLGYKPIHFSILAFYIYLLTLKKNKECFIYCVFIGICSLGLDLTSESTLGSLMISASLPIILIINDFIKETTEQGTRFVKDQIIAEKLKQVSSDQINGSDDTGVDDLTDDDPKSMIKTADDTDADNNYISDGSDLKVEKKKYRKKGFIRSDYRFRRCIAFFIAAFILFESVYCLYVRLWQTEDYNDYRKEADSSEKFPLDNYLGSGPLKGIYTDKVIAPLYKDAMSDLKLIGKDPDKFLFVADLCSWYYLAADIKYSTYSSFILKVDWQKRISRWWELHPDKLPDIIYVPYLNWDGDDYSYDTQKADDKVDFFSELFDFDIRTGKAGYILYIKGSRSI